MKKVAIIALVLSFYTPALAQLSKDAAITKAEAILKNLQEGKTADVVRDR